MRALRRVVERRWVTLVTTPGENGHTHEATFDEDGNGRTTTVAGHFHLLTDLRVLPERTRGGHVHELTADRIEGR